MAERYAISGGNWVAARFDGGTLPGIGDTVHANGFAVTIDTSITVTALSTRAGAVAVAGGSFTTSGAVSVNADTYAGTTNCLTLAASSNSVQNGNSYGSNTTNSRYGTFINYFTTQNGDAYGGNGIVRSGSQATTGGVLNGNSYGGSAAQSYGAVVVNFGIQNGNAYGSDTAATFGSLVTQRGILNGDTYGGSVAGAHGAEVSAGAVQNGDSYGGSATSTYGTTLLSAVQNGDSSGGSGASAFGTFASAGYNLSIHYGRQFGNAVTASSFGTFFQFGAICITTGITDGAAAGLRIGNDASVILQNGVTAGQVSNGAAVGRFQIGETLSDYPFVGGGGVAGFTGIRGTTRTLGT